MKCPLLHLQTLSGVGPVTYWFSLFICDLALYSIASVLQIIILLILDYPLLVSGFSIGPYILLLLCFAVGFLPQVYLLSTVIDKPATGLGYLFIFGFFIVLVCPMFVMIFDLLGSKIAKTLEIVFCILFSPYNLVAGVIDIEKNYNNWEYCKAADVEFLCGKNCTGFICKPVAKNPISFDGHGILDHILALLAQGAVFSILLYIKDRGVCKWAR